MWNNYGRIFAEYIFIKEFRFGKLSSNIKIEGQEIINEIIKLDKQVVFISGHLSNFELINASRKIRSKAFCNLSSIKQHILKSNNGIH